MKERLRDGWKRLKSYKTVFNAFTFLAVIACISVIVTACIFPAPSAILWGGLSGVVVVLFAFLLIYRVLLNKRKRQKIKSFVEKLKLFSDLVLILILLSGILVRRLKSVTSKDLELQLFFTLLLVVPRCIKMAANYVKLQDKQVTYPASQRHLLSSKI